MASAGRIGQGTFALATALATGATALAGPRASSAGMVRPGAAMADKGAKAIKPLRPRALSLPSASLLDPCIDGTAAACRRHALDGWRAGLAAQRAGTAGHPLRISYFGDSLTADDHIEQRLRTRLAPELGDGGPGFVFAAPPHPFCYAFTVKRFDAGGWTVNGVSNVPARDGLMGLGGSAESRGDGTVTLSPTATTIASAEVYMLGQPHGGDITITADGAGVGTASSAADVRQPTFARVELATSPGKLAIKTHGRVKLFGIVLEARRGIVVDNLGVVNGTVKGFLKNRPEHFVQVLAHRAPELAVIMFGTNEAGWLPPKGTSLDEHERLMGELLASVRQANPTGSCLVISPFDQLAWERPGAPPRAAIPAMVTAQRRAAIAAGCAFWDTYTWMGGKGSSKIWRRKSLLTNDFAHFTAAGDELIADALLDGLLGR